jgi:AcrR family transcriptional regulator
MPKHVDHDQRRRRIVESLWNLIGRRGLGAVTLRDLAAEAGCANGGLAPYFRNKDEILQAAFQHAFDRTDARTRAAVGDTGGLPALRRLCLEVMPLDEARLQEACVVIAFADRAQYDPRLAATYRTALTQWREQMRLYLRQARACGDLGTDRSDELVADTLLTTLVGFQTTAVLMSPRMPAPWQTAILDGLLDDLRPAPTSAP